ncbi:unnamed protein product [Rotaria sp. Silwood1]|nr:unnamed protein product [Rotaria sp. Silwood1]
MVDHLENQFQIANIVFLMFLEYLTDVHLQNQD